MSELPRGWVEATLEDLCEFNPKHDPETDRATTVSFIPMPAVDDETGAIVDRSAIRPLSEVWKGYTHFANADVIFAKITPCMENGKIAVARDLENGMACGSTEFHVLRSKGAVEPDFVWRFLRQRSYRQVAERSMTGAVGQRRVPKPFLEGTVLPLPPLAEQKRIVAKLDALNAKSARARTELARIETLVSRYKQAVLSKAFSGELTREWRGRGNPKTVADIADRIAEERAAMRSSRGLSREGSNRSVPLHDADLGVIPATWIWLNFGQCSYELTVGHVGPMKDRYVTKGIPFLRSLNVKENRIDFRNIAFIDDKFHSELKKSALQPGDLVVIRTGEPGVAAVVPDTLEPANCSDLVICRLVSSIEPHYAAFYMNSRFARSTVGDMQVGVAQQHFNVGAMSKMPLPVPPLEEQHEIVRRIESAFAKIDRLAKEAKRALELVGRLDETILAKAFRGELVPQDENDEPAEHLLARIRAEREAAPKGKRRLKNRA